MRQDLWWLEARPSYVNHSRRWSAPWKRDHLWTFMELLHSVVWNYSPVHFHYCCHWPTAHHTKYTNAFIFILDQSVCFLALSSAQVNKGGFKCKRKSFIFSSSKRTDLWSKYRRQVIYFSHKFSFCGPIEPTGISSFYIRCQSTCLIASDHWRLWQEALAITE